MTATHFIGQLCALHIAVVATLSAQTAASAVRGVVLGGARSQVVDIRDFALSAAGHFFALDYDDYTVKVVDAQGKVTRVFGGKGRGPGELWMPVSIKLVDSVVQVVDATNGLVTYSITGKHLSTARTVAGTAASPIVMRGGASVQSGSSPTRAGVGAAIEDTLVALTISTRVTGLDTLALIRRDRGLYRISTSPPIVRVTGFGNSSSWGTVGDSILVVADGILGVVRFIGFDAQGWRTVRSVTLGVQAQTVSAVDRRRAEARLARQTKVIQMDGDDIRKGPPPPVGRLEGAPAYWSVASHTLTSSDGTVWVGHYVEGESTVGSRWTIIARGAAPVRTVLPVGVRVRAVAGHVAYALTEDDDGFRVVASFRAVAAPAPVVRR